MDFYEYASIAMQFVNADTIWVPFLVGGLCFAIVFVFEAIALFTIAKREGYKNRWFAFVPFLNTYYIGVCAQKNKCFNLDSRTISLITAILEAVLFAGFTVYFVAVALVIEYYVPTGGTVTNAFGQTVEVYALMNVPENLYWAEWCFNFLGDYVLTWVELVFVSLEVMLFSAFFQTFAARRYFLFTLTGALLPIQGILFFIVRNNKGMNYREFMRREQERQYRMYQQYATRNYEQNMYNQNPYSRNPYDGAPPSDGDRGRDTRGGGSDDPFAEFGGDDPFSDDINKH